MLGGAGALVVVALIGVVLFATNVFGSDKLAGMKTLVKNGTCVETDFKKSMGREHTTNPKTKVVYTQSDPPTSGKHYQTPPPLMIYDEPVPQWILLHALEHGNVLVQYGEQGLRRRQGGAARRGAEPPRAHADGAVSEARQARRLHGLAAHAQLPGLPGGRAHGRAGQVGRLHGIAPERAAFNDAGLRRPARHRLVARGLRSRSERGEREAQERRLLRQRRIRDERHADVAAVDVEAAAGFDAPVAQLERAALGDLLDAHAPARRAPASSSGSGVEANSTKPSPWPRQSGREARRASVSRPGSPSHSTPTAALPRTSPSVAAMSPLRSASIAIASESTVMCGVERGTRWRRKSSSSLSRWPLCTTTARP